MKVLIVQCFLPSTFVGKEEIDCLQLLWPEIPPLTIFYLNNEIGSLPKLHKIRVNKYL